MSAIQASAHRSWFVLAQAVRPGLPPSGRRPAVMLASGAAGVAFAVAMIAVSWNADDHSLAAYGRSVAAFAITAAIGVTFLAAGLAAWWRRPDSPVGQLMVAAGTFWYASGLQLSGSAPLYALGFWLAYLSPVIVGHLTLAYPDGRLRPIERRAVFASYGIYLTLQGTRYLVQGTCHHVGLPEPAGSNSLCAGGPALAGLVSLDALVFDALFTFWVARRWLAASRPARRVHAPVWLGFSFHAAVLAATVLSSILHLAPGIQLAFIVVYGLCLLGLPFAFLSGLLRVRLARHRVTDLVLRLDGALGPQPLRDLLADALGDPSLALGLWSDRASAYVDAAGDQMPLPEADEPRAVTFVDRRGRRLAVLVHDPSLVDQRSLLQATVAAARLAIENARLAEAALNERRSIERDLHDGLQHRLLRLSWLADRAGATAEEERAAPLLAELANDARDAYVRLRELARGIHPAILTERGLAAAVEEHVLRVGLPVLVDLPAARCAAGVEAAAFFTIAEALTNAVKHAAASRVTVRGRLENGRLLVEIADDGAGGADPARGTGLRGLEDRAAALGGSLRVRSAPGLGTAIVLELPCG
jgi:signal transduction histidine kinase